MDKVICPICNRSFKYINNYHLKTHGYQTEKDFLNDYPDTKLRADSVISHFTVLNQNSEFQSNHAKGGWTDERRAEKSEQMREVSQELHHTDKYSDAKQRMITYGKKHKYITNDGRVLTMRSFLECRVAKFLELNGFKFEYEKDEFIYTISNKSHKYYPDFYLKDYDTYLEVKPSDKITSETDIKLQSVLDAGHKCRYITEQDLKNYDELAIALRTE